MILKEHQGVLYLTQDERVLLKQKRITSTTLKVK